MQYINKYNLRRCWECQMAMEKIMEVASKGGNISEATLEEMERISSINNLELAI